MTTGSALLLIVSLTVGACAGSDSSNGGSGGSSAGSGGTTGSGG